MWRFEVSDTGPGINEHDQKRLFQPFTQLSEQHRDGGLQHNGTGLGLSIVAQLARAMGGRTGLNSQPGKGSVFYFEIPLPRVAESLAPVVSA